MCAIGVAVIEWANQPIHQQWTFHVATGKDINAFGRFAYTDNNNIIWD